MDFMVFVYSLGIVVGLVGLWWSSDEAVEQALELSKLFGITTFFIGFVFLQLSFYYEHFDCM